MSRSTRVLVDDGDAMRFLYWFRVMRDESILFGSGGRQTNLGVASGTAHRMEELHLVTDAVEQYPVLAQAKHSIHASGELLGPALNGRRIRHQTRPLREYGEGPIGLVGVKPASLLAYPRLRGPERPSDTIFRWSKLDYRPFSFSAMAGRLEHGGAAYAPRNLRATKAHAIVASLGPYVLTVTFYTNTRTFRGWPRQQSEVISRSGGDEPTMRPGVFLAMP